MEEPHTSHTLRFIRVLPTKLEVCLFSIDCRFQFVGDINLIDAQLQRIDYEYDWFYNGSFPRIIAVFNNELYFYGTTDWFNYTGELWKTDGINTSMVDSKVAVYGTVFEGDLILWTDTGLESYDGINYSSIFTSHWRDEERAMGISVPIVSNGNLFFGTINENYVQELWMYDGTNTSLVATSYNPSISIDEGMEVPMRRLTQYYDDLYVVVDSRLRSIGLGENNSATSHLSTHVTRHLLIEIFCRITEEG